jgi:hypothetical protein
MTRPPAAGVRVAWQEVPAPVRAAIEDICGCPVVEARTQPGGFSPGVAARVVCADQTRHFVKAVSAEANPRSVEIHRQEAAILAALDPVIAARDLPIARLRGTVDQSPWMALVLQDIEGRHPAEPWRMDEIRRVVEALGRLGEALTPAPIAVETVGEHYQRPFSGWRRLAQSAESGPPDGLDPWARAHLGELAALEATWAEHAAGDTLLQTDVRADNLLLTDDAVFFVDWPYACRGAAFVDHVFFAPSVAMQGGPELDELLALSPVGRSADPRDVAAVLCAVVGYLVYQSLRPPPPGLPTVRAFQAAQAEVSLGWLMKLI